MPQLHLLKYFLADFLNWRPEPPANARALAQTSARLCRLLREEVLEQMQLGHASLLHLKKDWRQLLFPDASDEQCRRLCASRHLRTAHGARGGYSAQRG